MNGRKAKAIRTLHNVKHVRYARLSREQIRNFKMPKRNK